MTASPLTLAERQWFGWQDIPAQHEGWPPSPVLITAVTPLKSGKGLLDLHIIRPFQPIAAGRQAVRLKVLQHTPDFLLCAALEGAGGQRLVVITPLTVAWVREHCSLLESRLPPTAFVPYWDAAAVQQLGGQDYARFLFGEGEDRILHGATEDRFACPRPPMPARQTTLMLNATPDPFESWLIWRGVVPKEMEDKWFIYAKDDALLFRRSWTGTLVYVVETAWRGDRLDLGAVTANREPAEYGVSNDAHDRALLCWTIDVLLRRVPSPYPSEPT